MLPWVTDKARRWAGTPRELPTHCPQGHGLPLSHVSGCPGRAPVSSFCLSLPTTVLQHGCWYVGVQINSANVLIGTQTSSSPTSFLKREVNSPESKSVDLGLPLTEVQILSLSHTRQMDLGLLPDFCRWLSFLLGKKRTIWTIPRSWCLAQPQAWSKCSVTKGSFHYCNKVHVTSSL